MKAEILFRKLILTFIHFI